MSEGELYKRIHDKVRWSNSSFAFGLKPILDEAKQEWLAIEYKDKHDPKTTPEMTCRAEDEWFKKWFGE